MLVIILAPHPNCRYQSSLEQLSHAELEVILRSEGVEAAVQVRAYAGHNALCVDAPGDEERLIPALERLSGVFMICRAGEAGALYPLCGRAPAYLGEDLAGILKYKGKTSESFTRLLLNIARFSGDFAHAERPLDVLDPVCGKGTTLMEAINAGDNAFGIDVDDKALSELEAFIKRYFTYHHLKHAVNTSSLTAAGKPCRLWQASTARDAAAYKAGDVRTLSVCCCDTLAADRLLPRKRFHAIVGDLPYGVQHATHSNDARTAFAPSGARKGATIAQFTAAAVPVWAKLLLPGGVMALSFNTYTLSRDALRAQMRDCGLEVLEGGAYDHMEHWVEQAVSRDVAVARKPAGK